MRSFKAALQKGKKAKGLVKAKPAALHIPHMRPQTPQSEVKGLGGLTRIKKIKGLNVPKGSGY